MYKTPPTEKTPYGGVFLKRNTLGLLIAGFCAGSVTGLLGAGGGMILVPLLSLLTNLEEKDIFPASVCTILPVCIVSLLLTKAADFISIRALLPYLIGGVLGGIMAGLLGKKIPTKWLHRGLGILILWGGIRYLW